MKRIAFLIGSTNPYGAQRVVLDIITYLDKDKFRPYLIYWRDGSLLEKFKRIEGLKIIKLKTEPKHNPFAFYSQYKEIKKIIKENQIDILHTNLYVEDLYGSMTKFFYNHFKLISTKHDINPIPLWIQIPRWFFPKPDSQISISEAVQSSCHSSKVIYNGINIEKVNLTKPKFDRLTIVSVGRLIEKKGHRTLIRAVRMLNKKGFDFDVLIIGGGDIHFKAPKNVKFLGVRNDVLSIIKRCHIFVLMTEKEGLGLALIEASACKLPIVSSDIEGVNEVIENGKSGLLVRPKNSYLVSMAIKRLIDDAELRKHMGQNGFEIVKDKFNVIKMVRAYEKEYSALS